MNTELIAALDYWEKEKGIERSTLIEAVQNAVLASSRRAIGAANDLRIEIDPKTCDMRAFANLTVVNFVNDSHSEIELDRAKIYHPDTKIGDVVEIEVTPKNFGRIAAQTAKQAIIQRIRQVEKEMLYNEFKDRAGEIISGTVRRFEKSDVIIDLGKFEGVMRENERVRTEDYNIGDRIHVYIVAVKNENRGPDIILSRSHPSFVRRLFEKEVSEISDGTVEIRAIAREAGYRTKIAVWSIDDKVDPVGACVGMRGSRVKNIVRELNNEKVDIIRWSDDTREFVIEALKPAKIKNIELDQAKKSVRIIVDEDQLSLAIGKRGQNARLTARLTGWEINVEKDTSAVEKFENQVELAAKALVKKLDVSEEQASVLVKSGLATTGAFSDVEKEDIIDILGVGEEEAELILKKAHAANNHK